MFPWEVLKGSAFSASATRSPNLTGISVSSVVRFKDNTTASPTVTVVSSALGTYTIAATTTSWVVGPATLEITYSNSSGWSQTQKYPFNIVDPSATSTQTSFVNNDTTIIVSKR